MVVAEERRADSSAEASVAGGAEDTRGAFLRRRGRFFLLRAGGAEKTSRIVVAAGAIRITAWAGDVSTGSGSELSEASAGFIGHRNRAVLVTGIGEMIFRVTPGTDTFLRDQAGILVVQMLAPHNFSATKGFLLIGVGLSDSAGRAWTRGRSSGAGLFEAFGTLSEVQIEARAVFLNLGEEEGVGGLSEPHGKVSGQIRVDAGQDIRHHGRFFDTGDGGVVFHLREPDEERL